VPKLDQEGVIIVVHGTLCARAAIIFDDRTPCATNRRRVFFCGIWPKAQPRLVGPEEGGCFMLEIYTTQMKEINGRMVSDLIRLETIETDCWVNLTSPTEEELKLVETSLNLPPEFLRYALDEEERPRIDLDDDAENILIIADFPYIRREGNNAKYETQPVGIVLAAHKCLVTVSLREASVLEQFRNNRVRDFVTAYRTRFTFQIMFSGAKDYLKYLRYMDKTIDSAEHQQSGTLQTDGTGQVPDLLFDVPEIE
jgi:Mg2+ and Co2+ transporter CorA